MKIIINASTLRFGGAVQGALSLINELKFFPENEYHVFVGRGVSGSLRQEEFKDNFCFYEFNWGIISLWKIPLISKSLSKLEKEIDPDCIITTSGPSYWRSNAPHVMGYNLELYIYKESPFMGLMSSYRKIRWFIKRKLHFYFFRRDADAFYVQTNDVNVRIRKIFKIDKVFTVSNTHSSYFINNSIFPLKLKENRNGEIRLLTISAYYRHKNIEIIKDVSDELKNRGYNNIKFVITIDKENYHKIFGRKHDNVINIGPVKPEECASLYDECDMLFLPTLAECFSASYPEAMVMKKPIITTDLSFAHDICKNAALYYESMNPIAAADQIEMLMLDQNLQKTLIKNGVKRLKSFNSPNKRAEKILSICKNIIFN